MNEDEKVGNVGWVMFQYFCCFTLVIFVLRVVKNSRPVPMVSLSGRLTFPKGHVFTIRKEISPAELPGGFVWLVLFFLVLPWDLLFLNQPFQ